ncbi:hypothetical protein T484DRAFT_1889457, partial [Baffinella frigidus]
MDFSRASSTGSNASESDDSQSPSRYRSFPRRGSSGVSMEFSRESSGISMPFSVAGSAQNSPRGEEEYRPPHPRRRRAPEGRPFLRRGRNAVGDGGRSRSSRRPQLQLRGALQAPPHSVSLAGRPEEREHGARLGQVAPGPRADAPCYGASPADPRLPGGDNWPAYQPGVV